MQAKSERVPKPVERHLRGAGRAASAMSGTMRDDMVTHLAERCLRQVRAQAKIDGALDCESEVGFVTVADQSTVSSICADPLPVSGSGKRPWLLEKPNVAVAACAD